MKNLTVRAKLTWAFGLLAMMLLLIAGSAIKTLADANDRFEQFANGVNARVKMASHVETAIDRRAVAARDIVLATTAADIASANEAVMIDHKEATERLAKLVQMAQEPGVSEGARKLIAEIDMAEKSYAPVALDIVKLALAGKRDESIARMNTECHPLLAKVRKAASEYLDFADAQSTKTLVDAAEKYADQRNMLLVACGFAVLLAGVAGVLITRSLTRALGGELAELSAVMGRVADGDLSVHIALTSGDTSSVMATAARMQTALSRVVTTVRENSESVATASSQIAQGNQDLSGRTEQQASALQETAATMEELGTTVRNNADNAKQANQLAQSASTVAAQGGEVVGQVVTTMQGISESSRKIGDIISVIDGIAFQTNILALNAAVEAARAGEQGRGFAVVASEVRSLAHRSAEAAKEIKTLIGRSVEQVEQGTTLVDHAGKTMGEIVGSIKRVSEIVAEITSASVEQSSGVRQVGEAVNQMDQATQQNAALVEESAAAAESLKGQARQLVQAVAVFKLPGDFQGTVHVSTPEVRGRPKAVNAGIGANRSARPAKRPAAPRRLDHP